MIIQSRNLIVVLCCFCVYTVHQQRLPLLCVPFFSNTVSLFVFLFSPFFCFDREQMLKATAISQ